MTFPSSIWPQVSTFLPLLPHQIHVWHLGLELSDSRKNDLCGILSPDELKKASRFHFEKDRSRFIAARGMLRLILGYYLEEIPQRLRFEYSPYGKPGFGSDSGFADLKFNLSHSEGQALLAITLTRNLGIDLERIRKEITVNLLIDRFFSKEESYSLEKYPENQRNELFFQFWTRKEALLKATGIGLSFPMEKCDVSSLSGKKFSPVNLPHESSDWQVKDLIPRSGFAAALAIEGKGDELFCLHFLG